MNKLLFTVLMIFTMGIYDSRKVCSVSQNDYFIIRQAIFYSLEKNDVNLFINKLTFKKTFLPMLEEIKIVHHLSKVEVFYNFYLGDYKTYEEFCDSMEIKIIYYSNYFSLAHYYSFRLEK